MAHVIYGPNHEFAMRVLDARRNAKLTQEDVANRLGIDVRNISMYENGRQFPREGMVAKIAQVLNVDATWLATGNTQDTLSYLDQQRDKIPKIPTKISLLYVQDWEKIWRAPELVYNESPSNERQSADLDRFVPFAENFFARHTAVRYPGTKPDNVAYPAGCIIIFEAAPHTADVIPNGADVIFRPRGAENEAGLRRLVREPGLPTAMLVPLDSAAPFSPIPFDALNIEIIGVVVQRLIDHRGGGGRYSITRP